MVKNKSLKEMRVEYYGKPSQKVYVYMVTRAEALKYGEAMVSERTKFGDVYRFLVGVKMVRPIKRNPAYPERVLYELTFKKRVK